MHSVSNVHMRIRADLSLLLTLNCLQLVRLFWRAQVAWFFFSNFFFLYLFYIKFGIHLACKICWVHCMNVVNVCFYLLLIAVLSRLWFSLYVFRLHSVAPVLMHIDFSCTQKNYTNFAKSTHRFWSLILQTPSITHTFGVVCSGQTVFFFFFSVLLGFLSLFFLLSPNSNMSFDKFSLELFNWPCPFHCFTTILFYFYFGIYGLFFAVFVNHVLFCGLRMWFDNCSILSPRRSI